MNQTLYNFGPAILFLIASIILFFVPSFSIVSVIFLIGFLILIVRALWRWEYEYSR